MSGLDGALLASMLDGFGDAIVVVSPDGVISRYNAAAERLYGIPAEQARGQSIAILSESSEADYLQHATAAAGGQMSSFEATHVGRDGSSVELAVTAAPVRDETGAVVWVWCAARDVSDRKRTEREFVRLAEAAEYGTDAVVSMDFDGVVRHWNRGAERLFGVSAQEAIGKSIFEVNALTGQGEEANERARDVIARMRRGEPAYHMQARRRLKDGGLVDVLAMVTPWHVDGRLVGVTSTSLDITERARVEQAMARLAAIVESSDDAIIGKTLGGAITSWNPAAEQIYGYSAAEAIGRHVSMLAPGRDDELAGLLASVARGERVSHLETTRRCKDGRVIDVSVTASPIRDRQGQIVGAATIARDITERKRAEALLGETLSRLQSILDHAPALIYLTDLDGRFVVINDELERILGVARGQALGKPREDVLPADVAARHRANDLAVLREGKAITFEETSPLADGEHIYRSVKFPLRDPDGRIYGLGGISSDVTGQRTAERELQRLAQAAEHGSDSIISLDLDGRIRHYNRGAERIFGFRAQDVIGLSIAEFNALSGEGDQLTERLGALVGRALAGETVRQEIRRRRFDGTMLDLRLTLTPWRSDGHVVGVTSTTVDMTERKTVERELERLAQAGEHGSDAVISVDLDGRICHWSAGAEAVFGFSAQEMIGLSVVEWTALSGEDEEAVRRFSETPARVLAGETARYDVQRRHKNGTMLDLQVTLMPWRVDGRIVGATSTAVDITERKRAERARERALGDLEDAQRIAQVGSWSWNPESERVSWSAQMYAIFGRDPATGPPSIGEFLTYAHPDDRERVADAYAQAHGGQVMLELECRIVAGAGVQRTVHVVAHEDPAHPGAYLGTVQDVTRQRRAERERLELIEASARAESANRAKSEFLARMSHELRTPLNAIIGFSQLLELDAGLPARERQDIGHILRAGNHLLALVNEVLDLARIESGQLGISPEPVALADTVRDALALVAPLAAERNVSLRIDTDGLAHDGHVHVDRNRFKQVLLNLLSNAIKYNRPGGQVQISFQLTDPARVRTMIADTGIGIQPDRLAKLFEPFERLGAEQTEIEGTGLGLALSKGLIEAMGGTIEVQSTVGVGTTFTIELAAAQRPAPEHQPGPADQQLAELAGPDATRQLILYIEDNLSNLTLVERILQRHANVKLVPAMQGTLGLELARQHRPHLIILDLHLPDIQGTEVLKRLKADPITRETPVIVLTADASGRHTERVKQLGATDYLTKPLDVPRFIETIASNLTERSSARP